MKSVEELAEERGLPNNATGIKRLFTPGLTIANFPIFTSMIGEKISSEYNSASEGNESKQTNFEGYIS